MREPIRSCCIYFLSAFCFALVLMSGCVREVHVVKIPESPPALYRVNCAAAEPYKDSAGNEWLADQEFAQRGKWGALDGMTVDRRAAGLSEIENTDDDVIYLTERYSMQGYQFEVPNGRYLVRLHFAETYEGITDEGMRLFSVETEGKTVLKDLDVYKEAEGKNKAIVRNVVVEVSDGTLDITFVPNVQNPEVNGIEVLKN
ncbi:MAG: malectin domain-containing carbohydrate-binding protein [bacterium]|nr:malectin domain-containing carbohydrate-binding protein [bacterium]